MRQIVIQLRTAAERGDLRESRGLLCMLSKFQTKGGAASFVQTAAVVVTHLVDGTIQREHIGVTRRGWGLASWCLGAHETRETFRDEEDDSPADRVHLRACRSKR